jgi:hypothetical protein
MATQGCDQSADPAAGMARGGASRPQNCHSGAKAINPRGLGTESPSKQTLPMPRLRSVAFLALACCPGACVSPSSNALIITKYGAAACIPFSAHPRVSPHTREWDGELTLRNGAKVIVKGFDTVSGRITVSYPATGRDVVAADPNDYIYPSDVRLDAQNDLLYVKAHGLAVLSGEQTWLFEFDLRGQRILERRQIRNGILPMECPEPSQPQ